MSSVLTEVGAAILMEDGTPVSVEDIPGMITTADLRAHIETDLSDAELQKVIDAETAYLEAYAPSGTIVEEPVYENADRVLRLKRPAASVTLVRQRASDFTYTTIDASEYRVTADGDVERQTYWPDGIEITYVADDDTDLRESIIIDLCVLRLRYQSGLNQSMGDFSVSGSGQEIDRERARIMRRVRVRRWA